MKYSMIIMTASVRIRIHAYSAILTISATKISNAMHLYLLHWVFVLLQTTAVLGWFLSLATLFCLVYGLHLTTLEAWGSALYVSVGHTAWGAALAWIVIACCTGYGGCVNSALSFRMLQPLSRLTYCAYLVHPVVMVLTSFQMDGPMHIHNALTLILYFGNVVASFLLSFCISLTLEAPIVRLLKITLAPKARRSLKEINDWELNAG